MDGERSGIVLWEAPTRQSCHERPTQSFTLGRSKLGSAFDRHPRGSSATSLGARRSEEAGSSRESFSPSPQSIEDSHRHQSSGREQRPGCIEVCHKILNCINHRNSVGPVAPIGGASHRRQSVGFRPPSSWHCHSPSKQRRQLADKSHRALETPDPQDHPYSGIIQ